jgi:uncharacterized membrane protein YqgA involved in biofilm formation
MGPNDLRLQLGHEINGWRRTKLAISLRMNGAWINAAGIVVGGALGLAARKPIPGPYPLALKIILGVLTVWYGLKLTWVSLNGSFRQLLAELGLVILAMALGKLTGKLLHLQKLSNSIGRHATKMLSAPSGPGRFNDGFLLATGLFCVGPLALLASVQEGLNDFSPVFMVKAGIDGLATWAFCERFGWGAILSVIPVLALENALIRGGQLLEPVLRAQPKPMLDAINATDGLLIFCVAMIILGLKKIEVADYFPSLALAPLLTWLLW